MLHSEVIRCKTTLTLFFFFGHPPSSPASDFMSLALGDEHTDAHLNFFKAMQAEAQHTFAGARKGTIYRYPSEK
jgi:hypothetical protein